ncbi:phosphoribosylglycinamide formyltransferase [Saccharibacillus alkalitolerans]|nr:phosphoribosylglycinamide formyltransferase [Saccharibacillus alkalitolerans]
MSRSEQEVRTGAEPLGSDEQVPQKPGPMPSLPNEPAPEDDGGAATAALEDDPAVQLMELEEALPQPVGPVIDRPYRVAVFASGSGSNFQALLDASRAGNLGAQISLLVCDKPQARVVERARAAGVPIFVFTPKEYESREAYERLILAELEKAKIDLVVLAGYMRLITSVLVEPYAGRMINIHPSLLPSFPGKDAAGQAIQHGVRVSGATVHFVDGGMDTGPIIAQRAVEVMAEDTAIELQARIQDTERLLYPEVVSWFAAGRVKLEGRKVVLFNNEH